MVAGEVLEEFILDACFWNGVGRAEESCRGWDKLRMDKEVFGV